MTASDQGQPEGSNNLLWTILVAVPPSLAALRLWVAAGGSSETTRLLLQNLDLVNLATAALIPAAWLLSAILVAVFSAGAVALASCPAGARRPLVAQVAAAAPAWLVVASFLLAAATWHLLYLPLLLLAGLTYKQVDLLGMGGRRWVGLLGCVVFLAAWWWLLRVAIEVTWRGGYWFELSLLVVPALLAVAGTGPVHRGLLPVYDKATTVLVVAAAAVALAPVVSSPLLPLSVLTLSSQAGAGEAAPQGVLRGHVVNVDDVHTTLLQEGGGVAFVDNARITARIPCPEARGGAGRNLRLPVAGRTARFGESILQNLGRAGRDQPETDRRCHVELAG